MPYNPELSIATFHININPQKQEKEMKLEEENKRLKKEVRNIIHKVLSITTAQNKIKTHHMKAGSL